MVVDFDADDADVVVEVSALGKALDFGEDLIEQLAGGKGAALADGFHEVFVAVIVSPSIVDFKEAVGEEHDEVALGNGRASGGVFRVREETEGAAGAGEIERDCLTDFAPDVERL